MENAGEGEMNFPVIPEIEHQSHDCRNALSENRSVGRARDAHGRASEQSKNHDRIHDDIDHRAGQLRYHAVHRQSSGLQQPLKGDLKIRPRRDGHHNPQILAAVLQNFRVTGLRRDKGPDHREPEHQCHQCAQNRKENAVVSRLVRPVKPLFSERARQKRIDTDACARRHGDDQILHRKRQRDRRQRPLRKFCDEDGVHDVIQRLHEHGYHHRHRHIDDQLFHRHDAHLIFFAFLVCLAFLTLLVFPVTHPYILSYFIISITPPRSARNSGSACTAVPSRFTAGCA